MAENAQQVSSLPSPPMQYANLYSDENIKRGRAPPPPPPIKVSEMSAWSFYECYHSFKPCDIYLTDLSQKKRKFIKNTNTMIL